MRFLALTAALAATSTTLPALAQEMPPAYSMTDKPCGPPPPRPPREMMMAMLKPGAKLPATMTGGPDDKFFQQYIKMRDAQLKRDFGDLCRYKPDNTALAGQKVRVVFMGDSITEGWAMGDETLFTGGVVDRGISGQTSPQMVLRFQQDVVALRPAVVHIMAGINDVSGATGPSSPEDLKNNIRAMVDMAQAHRIKVVLASILPTNQFMMRKDLHPAQQVRELNVWLRAFAAERGLVYADYYPALATPEGAFNPALSNDGLHPNIDGYAVMRPITDAALKRALARK